MVFYGLGNSETPLQGKYDSSKDWRDCCHTLKLVEEVGKGVGLDLLIPRSKVFPDWLKKGASDEDVVEDREEDEHPVEDGGHALAQQDGNGDEISSEADCSYDDLERGRSTSGPEHYEQHLFLRKAWEIRGTFWKYEKLSETWERLQMLLIKKQITNLAV